MSGGLPTDQQLRRIERGVRDRIARRRRTAHRIVGSTAGVLVLVGGIALVAPLVGTTGGGAGGSGSAAGGASAARVEVRCHLDGRTRTVTAPDEADRIAAACGGTAVEFQNDRGRVPSGSPAPSLTASDPATVVCRAADGVLDVYPAGDRPGSVCERHGLRPY